MEEIWKKIEGVSDNFEISNLGRVRNLFPEVFYLKPSKGVRGYIVVNLKKNGKRQPYRLHRLVAIAFIPNPKNKPNINHIDNNKSNNRVDNLEWVTQNENVQHAKNIGVLNIKGEKHPLVKLTEREVREIRLSKGLSHKELSEKYNVCRPLISMILSGKRWPHIK